MCVIMVLHCYYVCSLYTSLCNKSHYSLVTTKGLASAYILVRDLSWIFAVALSLTLHFAVTVEIIPIYTSCLIQTYVHTLIQASCTANEGQLHVCK